MGRVMHLQRSACRQWVVPLVGPIVLSLGLVAGVSVAAAATWTIQTTPNATGAEHSQLYDIACYAEATKPCVSVGKLTESGGKTAPYAQSWNGTNWTNITAGVPEKATAGELQSVDCVGPEEFLLCFGAGSYASSGVTKSLILFGGIGGLPTVQETPNPEGASETAFKGISCRQSLVSACFAVGYTVKSGKKTAFAVGQSEGKWVTQTMPEPAGATSSELHGVDCASTTACMAVGSYSLSAEEPQWAWSATWNGTSWTLRTVAKPTGAKRSTLLDVSCASTISCTGVGGYRNSSNVQVSLVERWNGSTWSHQASPNPEKTTNTVFQGVSCLTGALCVGVGDWNNGKIWQPMAQEWNGSAWALDTTPLPAGAGETILEGVACRSSCLASGWYTDSGGKIKTLGESR